MQVDVPEGTAEQVREFYGREDVRAEMVRVFEDREAAPTYPWGYGTRPDAVNFPGDFDRFVEDDAVAFHGSVERWRNPMLIDEVDQDDLRTGWDLIIDIDCDRDMSFAKETAVALLRTFRDYGIDSVSVKFSGNRGFHLGIPREAFPAKVQGEELAGWYPDLPQAIVSYLRAELREDLAERFVEMEPGVKEEVYEDGEPAPYGLSDIENDWGSRHLFRMPYSVNEKSWLVSLPLPATADAIRSFEKDDARMEAVEVEERFLERDAEPGEAAELVVDALDWRARNRDVSERETFDGEFELPDEAIPEEHFPPTIKNILDGLEDGRKRSLFILITFLQHVGYDLEAVRRMVWEWNDRNDEALDETYVTAQLNWHERQDEPLMPPNWDSRGFYHDIGVYEEDALTEATSNPVSYAFAKAKDDEDHPHGADDEGSGGDGEGDGSGSKSAWDDKEIMECPYCGKEYKGETKWYRDHVQECQG